MKSALAITLLLGLFLAVDSQCNEDECTEPTTNTCSALNAYIDCLQQQLRGCVAIDPSTKDIVDSTIKYTEDLKAAAGCSAGGGSGGSGSGSGSGSSGGGGAIATVSISTLVFSLLAFYLKP